MKRIFCLLLSLLMTLALVSVIFALPTAAEEGADPAPEAPLHNYIDKGLYAWYSGEQNTRAGLDTAATVWDDLVGGHDLTINADAKNYFTEEGLHVQTAKHVFSQDIVSVVNGDSFTVEIEFGEFKSIGDSFNTFMNSSNDNFALFRRNSENVIEWKFGGGSIRPKVPNALDHLPNHLITVTYEYGESVVMYVDGVEMARKECPLYMGANDLFIGHSESSKDFEAVYKNIRFYTRALSAGEVLHNAAVDGYADIASTYVQDGLVSLYSGTANTESGYDPASAVWADLVGENDLPVTVNDNNYFTAQGLRVTGRDTTIHYFPQPIVDLVNGQSFTVEILFDDFVSVGSAYNTFMNSTNDNFALYRNSNTNQLIFKFAANPGNERPVVEDGLYVLDNSLITVTYTVGGKCRIYRNGKLQAEVDCPKAMGANNLFIGQRDPVKTFDSTYKSIRFYNRELTAEEVYLNAQADGVTAVAGEAAANPGYVSVAQPVTNIIGDVAMVREIGSKDELDGMLAADLLPASAVFEIDASLNVSDSSGKAFTTVPELLVALGYRILPCFVISDKAEADALRDLLFSMRFYDVQLMSADREVLKYAREIMPSCYGILDMREAFPAVTDLTEAQLLDIRRAVKTYNASVAVLPVALCNNEDVQYLYDRQVNVWAACTASPDVTEQYYALLSGAVGVVSDATGSLLDIACNKLQQNTMTRLPINIGHRGIPAKAPENCIEGAMYAYELGAQVIEIDVYLTKDKQAVLMHDGTTGRTCNKDISVEGSTLAELTALYCNKGFEKNAKFKEAKVPSLDDFLAAFVGTDVRFYIEIKSGGVELVTIVKELIEKNGMYGQCSVITFSSAVMENFRNIYPEMSVGGLCQAYMNGEDPESDFRAAMNFIGKHNATLNPRYSANGSTASYDYAQNDLRTAMIRGIQVHPWTFAGGTSAYAKHFIWGYSGLTGDNANAMGNVVNGVSLGEMGEIEVGATVEPAHTLTTYRRNTKTSSEMAIEILSGAATAQGNLLTATGEGEIVLITYTEQVISKEKYVLYTQPVTVQAKAEQTTEQGTTEPPEVTEPDSTEQVTEPEEQNGCKSLMSVAVAVIAIAAVPTVFKKKD